MHKMQNPPILLKTFLEKPKISTDTRKIQQDSIFFALKGANFNGNKFVQEALDKGAFLAVVDEAVSVKDADQDKVVFVKDALEALQILAHDYRQTLEAKVIAIGGSNGKTTTKELLYAVLSKKYKTACTAGNLNNHIGVPLTLLGLAKDTEIAIIEMGANHAEEYTLLAQIAAPTFGLITNIGKDHLEGFGSVEGVAKANGELFDYLAEKNGIIFLNTEEPWLRDLAKAFEEKQIFTYPRQEDYCPVTLSKQNPFLSIAMEGQEINTHLFGIHNFANISTALCMGKYFEVPTNDALEAIAAYQPANNRSQIVRKGSNTIILDAYNANPSSMQKAIESFDNIEASHKMLIVGDMYELGDHSLQEHQTLGKLIADKGFDTVLLYGEAIKDAIPFIQKAYYFESKFLLHQWLEERTFEDTFFLIKGSRGNALETVLESI